ncbi:GtrA family protein [Clostridium sp. D53t1_180928_C8]|uniref:GtrA family protein n=1 Tax=Clostridium sp. D53t1_180928_C8 TaxID=2787101 RepID=UPI001A9B6092|nr:GtrA family protein [Clostridium sp. D53t1_180928_C8]
MDTLENGINKFIKFGLVGVLNTLINWIIFAVLNFVGVYYIVANIIAYAIATANSYIWNSKWVFKYNGKDKKETTIKFVILNLIGLALNTAILYFLVDILLFNKLIGLVITTVIVMVINYIVNKIWVFKEK